MLAMRDTLPCDRPAETSGWEAIDRLAGQLAPPMRFLRGRWFTAGVGAPDAPLLARAPDGAALAGFPLTTRRFGPVMLNEVGGCYWPMRSVPFVMQADVASLSQAMTDIAPQLGRVWRLGPVAAGDPALASLIPAARSAGWQVLCRTLGTLFELDLAALRATGEWPSAKTRRKNRWRIRRLEEDHGPVTIRYFTGTDWTVADRDAMATIETHSWLGKLADGGDTKFRDPARRLYWERLCDDTVLAASLFGSVMTIGDTPAAFTFGIESGATRYYIANNYDDRFTQFGPGRILLYADFERAAEAGVAQVSWGLGDAGYKTEMGAQPGEDLLDLLFVRGRVLAGVLRPIWERRG